MPNNDGSSEGNGLSQRLARLEDLEALGRLKSLYAVNADKVLRTPSRAHAVALSELFTDDAVGDYGFFGRFEGKAALLDAFENVLPAGTGWSTHYLANPVLDVQGSQASGTWYFLIYAQAKSPPFGPTQNFFGHYEDQYVKSGGIWRHSSLIVHYAVPPAAPL